MRLSFCILLSGLVNLALASQKLPVPKGFATTKGTKFQVDGKPFVFVGANSYWLPLLTTHEDVDRTFKEMQGAGIKILRTWGFNAINGSELAGARETGLTYYQVWNGTKYQLNDGPQGLQRLDYVINTAGKYGIKVILALTNNWIGYGGMELYINWISPGGSHDVFYSDPAIISEYQRYVTTIVKRYKNSPNVFAWELMNEARCRGDLQGGPNCVAGTELLSGWYKDQSNFIRKLDPYHLITTGGEGHFYWKENPVYYWFNHTLVSDYNFNGQAGENFDLDLTFDNIDFGTYHIYPEYWYGNLNFPGSNFSLQNWGLEWISSHAQAGRKANKPVILEEFGLSVNKTAAYTNWVKRALDTGHAGIMPWQFGMLGLTENGGNYRFKYEDFLLNGASPNDGFAIYKNSTEWNIFKDAAKVQASRSG